MSIPPRCPPVEKFNAPSRASSSTRNSTTGIAPNATVAELAFIDCGAVVGAQGVTAPGKIDYVNPAMTRVGGKSSGVLPAKVSNDESMSPTGRFCLGLSDTCPANKTRARVTPP